MKKFTVLFGAISLLAISTSAVSASPITPDFTNPNVVIFYTNGVHGIVGESDTHTGIDLVMAGGQSGVFHQWFLGTSDSDGYHGDHSVWKLQTNGECASSWTEVVNANQYWGSYLNDGNYCVKTNDFSGQH